MKMNNFAKVLGAFLLTGFMSGNVFAAEDAHGVAAAFDDLVKSSKAAAASAAAGDKEGCLTNVKAAKQSYKQLTGSATGKPMQDAIKQMSEGMDQCRPDGDVTKAAPILAEVAGKLEKLKSEQK